MMLDRAWPPITARTRSQPHLSGSRWATVRTIMTSVMIAPSAARALAQCATIVHFRVLVSEPSSRGQYIWAYCTGANVSTSLITTIGSSWKRRHPFWATRGRDCYSHRYSYPTLSLSNRWLLSFRRAPVHPCHSQQASHRQVAAGVLLGSLVSAGSYLRAAQLHEWELFAVIEISDCTWIR